VARDTLQQKSWFLQDGSTKPCFPYPSPFSSTDPRIKAAVIIDPAPAFFFQTDDLKEVKVLVQLWSSDPKLSADHVSGCCAIGINRRLPSKPDYHLVSNAIHFSFLARCSPQEVRDFPRICIDAPDFDRVGFHKNFHADVVAFFRKHLIEPARP
jgi:predicted dienelactone hydrolase